MAKRRDGHAGVSVHLLRHARHKLGATVEELAKEEGVQERAILKSIALVDMHRLNNTPEVLNAEIIDTIIGRNKKMAKALDDALDATVVGREGAKVPDHKTKLAAVDRIVRLVKEVQPKRQGGGIKLNVQQQTGVHQAVVSTETPFTGFEERLRTIRHKIDQRNQLPPPESVAAPLGENELDLEDEQEEVVSGGPAHTQGERVSE